MPDVAIRAVGTPVYVNDTQVSPIIPAETQDGDLMIALCFHRIQTGATWNDLTGWTKYNLYGNYCSIAIYLRIKQSGDGTPTFTNPAATNSLIGVIISVYNHDPSTPIDVTPAGAEFTGPGSPYDVTIATFNTLTNGALAFMAWASQDDNSWAYQSGGGNQLVSQNNTLGSDNSCCIVSKSMPTAGAVGAQVARQTLNGGDFGRKIWFAIKPAVGVSYSAYGSSESDVFSDGKAAAKLALLGASVVDNYSSGMQHAVFVSKGESIVLPDHSSIIRKETVIAGQSEGKVLSEGVSGLTIIGLGMGETIIQSDGIIHKSIDVELMADPNLIVRFKPYIGGGGVLTFKAGVPDIATFWDIVGVGPDGYEESPHGSLRWHYVKADKAGLAANIYVSPKDPALAGHRDRIIVRKANA